MSEGSPRFYSWWTWDWVPQYVIIAFVCTVTSRRVECGCMVRSFTTLGECVLSLSIECVGQSKKGAVNP